MQHGLRAVHHARSLKAPPPSKERPVLYTHTCCPYAQRALMGLLHKGVPFDLVQIDLSSKPSWYRGVNPRGLVPAVAWQGATTVESVDIVRWLDITFPDAPASLSPSDPAAAAAVDKLIDRAAPAIVSAGLDAAAGASGRSWGLGGGASAAQIKRFEGSLQPLADALSSSGGPFLTGLQLSAADVVIFPFVERFDLALRLFSDYDLAGFDRGSISKWQAAVRSLPAGRLACAADGALEAAFKRHRSLDWFDYETVDVGALHPQLLAAAAEAGGS